ncbi:olfactory receptor 2A14-like [Pelodytes ibericus]
MYFFLGNIAFLDLCYSTNATPKFLVDVFSIHRTITFAACTIQLYASLFLGTTECLLLAVMAYDRYAAICHPLHYPILMSMKICCKMAIFVWVFSFFISIVPSLTMPISLCYPNTINHFMCEVLAVLKLACKDAHQSDLVIFSISFFSLLLPFTFILVSYACIISSVLKIRSVERRKAFSTCSSHIFVVVLCFGSAMVLYFGSSSKHSSNQEKYISVFYVIITPMLNPLIYNLKNHEISGSFNKMLMKVTASPY